MILLLRFLFVSAVLTVGGIGLLVRVLPVEGVMVLLVLPVAVALGAADLARARRRRAALPPPAVPTALGLSAAYVGTAVGVFWAVGGIASLGSFDTVEMRLGTAIFLATAVLILGGAAWVGLRLGGGAAPPAGDAAASVARPADPAAAPGMGAMVVRFLLVAGGVVAAEAVIRAATGYGNLVTSLVVPAMGGSMAVADLFHRRAGFPLAGAAAWAVTLACSGAYGALQLALAAFAFATGAVSVDDLPASPDDPLLQGLLAVLAAVLFAVVVVTVRSFIAIGGRSARKGAARGRRSSPV